MGVRELLSKAWLSGWLRPVRQGMGVLSREREIGGLEVGCWGNCGRVVECGAKRAHYCKRCWND